MALLKSVKGRGKRSLMVMLLYLTLVSLASAVVAEKLLPHGDGYYALLIGQAVSPGDGQEAMAAVENDLRGFQKMLEGMTATPYRIHVCVDPKGAGIAEALRSLFQEAEPEDLCLVYYGGHGKNSAVESRRALMIGTDGETLSAEELLKLLKAVPGKKVLILDSCYAGMLIETRQRQADDFGEDELFILAGAGSDEEALNSGSGPDACGLFTWSLLYGSGYDERTGGDLPDMPADQDGNGGISLREAYLYTHALTSGVSGAQHPQMDPPDRDIILWSK